MFIVLVRSEKPSKKKHYKYPEMSERIAFECAIFLSEIYLIPNSAVRETANMISIAGYITIPCKNISEKNFLVSRLNEWIMHFDVKAVIEIIEVGNE